MAKLLVVDPADCAPVPFLRGILTRRLQNAGLSFDDAYALASQVRDSLGGEGETPVTVTTHVLRDRVVALLRPRGPEVVERYLHRPGVETVLVRHPDEEPSPYSRGRHRLSLQRAGLIRDDATLVAAAIHAQLTQQAAPEIDLADLWKLTRQRLLEFSGPETARRYDLWAAFRKSRRPLILLIGGSPGSGKSSISARIAHVLDIIWVQSTDMLREVMRIVLPPRLAPALHQSSFLAWRAVPQVPGARPNKDAIRRAGFLEQKGLLEVACEAVLKYSLGQRYSMVLEGVQVHPSLLELMPQGSDAVVVPVMLSLLKRSEYQRRIRGLPAGRADRYMEHFEDIWWTQSFLLSEADRAGVPIVPNDDRDHVVQQVMLTVAAALEQAFPEV